MGAKLPAPRVVRDISQARSLKYLRVHRREDVETITLEKQELMMAAQRLKESSARWVASWARSIADGRFNVATMSHVRTHDDAPVKQAMIGFDSPVIIVKKWALGKAIN